MRKHNRGAVTVFVTLLLIPAILVSGTGVDLSRVYAARSMTRDANQLAANALLTNYDTLLQDLYGLYAVVGDDDDLTAMVDLYVKASLFGEDVTAAQLGEFRLFSGQESVSTEVSGSDPLSTVKILRHQIEEYSKYRVPVAIVSDILDRLENSGATKMGANTEAAAQKLEVDNQAEKIVNQFAAILQKTNQIRTRYHSDESSAYISVYGPASRLEKQFRDLLEVRDAFAASTDMEDATDHFEAIQKNIQFIGATGGHVGSNWVEAHVDDDGNDVPGAWGDVQNLSTVSMRDSVENYKNLPDGYTGELDELESLCMAANSAKSELQRRITELEAHLNSGSCSEELAQNMRQEIDVYKELLNVDFEKLGETYRQKAQSYMNTSIAPIRDLQGYSTETGSFISFSDMENNASLPGFTVNFTVDPAYRPDKPDKLRDIQGTADVREAPKNFPKFQDASPEHQKCCELLERLNLSLKSEDEELSNEEKQGKSNFKSLFKQMKELWDGLTDYDPVPGAGSYPSSTTAGSWAFSTRNAGMELDFSTSDFKVESSGNDKEQETGMRSTLKTFAGLVTGKTSAAELFSNALANGANRVLLVGYITQMFSNWNYKYTYEGKDAPLSLTGQPISAANNYFYSSEWEYLVNGNLDAGKNLGKAIMTILAIRFLANYASSYMVSSVNTEVREMEAVVSAIPFAGGALRFLVRPLYVLGESLVDASLLRSGHGIPLVKTNRSGGWRFSLYNFAVSVIKNETKEAINTEQEKQKGLLYTDYLVVFLLVTDPDVLASRIGDLIALNVTTSQEELAEKSKGSTDARAEAAKKVDLLDLSKANTTFSVKTQTEVRFMFLSMPFAQQGINGVVPPPTFPVVVTDYRGY